MLKVVTIYHYGTLVEVYCHNVDSTIIDELQSKTVDNSCRYISTEEDIGYGQAACRRFRFL